MAIKVKKQTRRDEINEPDQILSFNQTVFNFIETHRKALGAGLVGVLLVTAGISFVAGSARNSDIVEGSGLLEASRLLAVPIGEGTETEGDVERFATVEVRAEAIQTSLGDAVDSSGAALLAAGAAFTLGETGEALTQYQAAASSEAVLIRSVGQQALAAAQAAGGDLAAARQTLEQLSVDVPSLALFAQLEQARLAESAGDVEGALALYRDVAAGQGSVDFADPLAALAPPTGDRAMSAQAAHRAALLEVLLGLPVEQDLDDVGGLDD